MNDEKALAQRRRLSRVVGRPGCNIVNNVNCCAIIDLAHDSVQKNDHTMIMVMDDRGGP